MKTQKFLCSYHHDGADWSIILDAYDWTDANDRARKLGFLRLDGQLVTTTRFGWLARLLCRVRRPVPATPTATVGLAVCPPPSTPHLQRTYPPLFQPEPTDNPNAISDKLDQLLVQTKPVTYNPLAGRGRPELAGQG